MELFSTPLFLTLCQNFGRILRMLSLLRDSIRFNKISKWRFFLGMCPKSLIIYTSIILQGLPIRLRHHSDQFILILNFN